MNQIQIPRHRAAQHIRSIPLDLILALLTCMIWNLYVQHRQMQAVNDMLDEDRYRFWLWFFLSLITCGLYHFYHEYRMSDDIESRMEQRQDQNAAIISLLLCVFGLSVVADAIQQARINRYYGSEQL